MNIDTILPYNIDKILTPDNTPLLFWGLFSVVTSVLLSALIKKTCKRRWGKASLTLGQRWVLRLMPMAAPVLALLLMAVGITIFKRAGIVADISPTIIDAILSWAIIAAIYTTTLGVGKTVFAAVLIVSYATLNVFGLLPDVIDLLNSLSVTFGKTTITAFHLLKFIISVVVLTWVAGALVSGTEFSFQRMHLRSSTRQLFTTLTRTVIYIIAGLIALNALGIDLTAFAIFGGALGVGLGFGLQKIASNFISGIILLVERSIDVNDMIEITTGTTSVIGLVKHTGARYTLIETFDSREIMIPNEDFMTNRVINWTYSSPRGLLKVPVIVSYDSDLDRARDLILEAAREHPRCLKDPAPSCLLQDFTDLAVSFNLFVWIGDIRENRLSTQSEILFAVWKKLTENNIGIPHQARMTQLKSFQDAAVPIQEEEDEPAKEGGK